MYYVCNPSRPEGGVTMEAGSRSRSWWCDCRLAWGSHAPLRVVQSTLLGGSAFRAQIPERRHEIVEA